MVFFWDSNLFFFLDGFPFVRGSWCKIMLGGVSFEIVFLLFYIQIWIADRLHWNSCVFKLATELPQTLAKDQPRSHGMTTVFKDYVLYHIYLHLILQLKISSLMNLIFSLFQTWILQATADRKIQFKLGKKCSSSNTIFQTGELQK